MLRWFEHSQVFHPDPILWANGTELGRPREDIFFAADDGVRLNGWFFPGSPDSPRAQFAVLFCHGNAGNISHRLETCAAMLSLGLSVFVFDYRGYGRSQGYPTEAGTYLDALAAHQWLQRKGFPSHRIIALGESLGGGVVSDLGLRVNLAGLILQSTFTSIPALGAELFPWLPVRWLATIQYDTQARLPRLRVPILVMHSREDELVRFHHAEQNFHAANEPKLFCELIGLHNGTSTKQERFVAGLESFLRMLERTTAAPASASTSHRLAG